MKIKITSFGKQFTEKTERDCFLDGGDWQRNSEQNEGYLGKDLKASGRILKVFSLCDYMRP
jgi:hypothetical protein